MRRRGCLGDGLQHVVVAADGGIWAGYFDEGVFGNLGWGGPGPEPLGAAGIVRWSPELEKTWELDPRAGLVADCYALTVADDGTAWACTYTDFPLVRIAGGEVRVTPTTDVAGPSGLLVDGDRVALLGSYRDPGLLVVGEVLDGRFRVTRSTSLRSPDGAPLPAAELRCRGAVATVVVGPDLYAYELAD